jgi:hypothetical protein
VLQHSDMENIWIWQMLRVTGCSHPAWGNLNTSWVQTTEDRNIAYLCQRWTNPWNRIVAVTKFSAVAPNVCDSQARNLLYATFLTYKVLGWSLDFWKICATLIYVILQSTLKMYHFRPNPELDICEKRKYNNRDKGDKFWENWITQDFVKLPSILHPAVDKSKMNGNRT